MKIEILDHVEAMALTYQGDRDDIYMMLPLVMADLKVSVIREGVKNGAVFASIREEPKSQPDEGTNTGPDQEDQEDKPDKRRRVKLDTGKVMALHNNGWSNRKIADEMGCSEGTIWNCLKKMEGRNE